MFAVSRKLPPASAKASNTPTASVRWLPHPHSVPNVIVPSASSDTRRPDRPSSLYRIIPPRSSASWARRAERGLLLDPLEGPPDAARGRSVPDGLERFEDVLAS